MQANTILTLAQYIAELHGRNRFNYGTNGGGAFDSTIEADSTGDQGDQRRDERCDQDNGG